MSRHIIFGDIHGCYAELLDLLDRVGATDDDILVSVGDLVDRGPDSPSVLRLFRERRGAVVLMGNHERKHVRGIFSYSQEITRLQLGDEYAAAVEWMSRLPYHYETPDFIAVHAAVAPDLPLEAQKEEILAGTVAGERELAALMAERSHVAGATSAESVQSPGAEPRWWHEVYAGPKPIVFGHHVVGDAPLVERGLIYGLDTGACHGGRLTALVVPGFELVSVPARADHWASERRRWQEAVLLAKPWSDWGWAKTRRELDRYGDEGGQVVAALGAWLDAVEGSLAGCLDGLVREAERIAGEGGDFTDRTRSHPYKALLHQARRGRLDLETIRKHCSTPRLASALAAHLGVPVPPSPPAQR